MGDIKTSRVNSTKSKKLFGKNTAAAKFPECKVRFLIGERHKLAIGFKNKRSLLPLLPNMLSIKSYYFLVFYGFIIV